MPARPSPRWSMRHLLLHLKARRTIVRLRGLCKNRARAPSKRRHQIKVRHRFPPIMLGSSNARPTAVLVQIKSSRGAPTCVRPPKAQTSKVLPSSRISRSSLPISRICPSRTTLSSGRQCTSNMSARLSQAICKRKSMLSRCKSANVDFSNNESWRWVA